MHDDVTPTPATPPVLVLGEALIDVVVRPDGSTSEYVGGSPANVAKGVARLGHDAILATHLAHDARGDRIAAELAADGVRFTDRTFEAERTPTATAHLDASGAASYDFDLAWKVERSLRVPPGGHLHTGSIAATLEPGATAVRLIADRNRPTATISYDPNARPGIMGDVAQARAQVEVLAARSDVVKVSDEDLSWLYGEGADVERVARLWQKGGPSLIVLTRGGAGSLAFVDGEAIEYGAGDADVVDTVGAGDSFMAGLISGLLDLGYLGGPDARARLSAATHDDVRPAIERAVACAAITVSRAGANPPTRAELGL